MRTECFMGALGLCVGSFCNVFAGRYPKRQDFIFQPSHCPRCFRTIRWYENIPLFSWLALGGRCSSCRGPISARYPLVELAFGLLFFLMAALFPARAESLVFLFFFTVLFLIALVDIETLKVYDVLTYPLIFAGLLPSLFFPGLYGWRGASLLGGLGVGGVTLALAWLGKKVFGREALGFGDIKLMTAAGGFLGWQHGLCAMLDAVLAGSLVAVWLVLRGFKMKDAFPFAPFLVLGCLAEGIDLLLGSQVPRVLSILFR